MRGRTASVVSVNASNSKNPVVTIKAGKALAKPISLAQIKDDKLFADSPLVRQRRLSVRPSDESAVQGFDWQLIGKPDQVLAKNLSLKKRFPFNLNRTENKYAVPNHSDQSRWCDRIRRISAFHLGNG